MTGRTWWLSVGVLAAACLVFALVWLSRSLNSVVKAGVERYGPEVTGTRVTLGSVDLRLREARGSLRTLRIRNPEGFSADDAITLGEITLDLRAESLMKEPIVIETFRISGPSLLLELSERGEVNLRSLQSHVEQYAPAKGSGSKSNEREDQPLPRIVIRTLSVEGGKIRLDARAVGGKLSEKELGGFTLRDVGGTNGVPADELGQEVLRAILKETLHGTAANELRRRAEDTLREGAGKLLQGLVD